MPDFNDGLDITARFSKLEKEVEKLPAARALRAEDIGELGGLLQDDDVGVIFIDTGLSEGELQSIANALKLCRGSNVDDCVDQLVKKHSTVAAHSEKLPDLVKTNMLEVGLQNGADEDLFYKGEEGADRATITLTLSGTGGETFVDSNYVYEAEGHLYLNHEHENKAITTPKGVVSIHKRNHTGVAMREPLKEEAQNRFAIVGEIDLPPKKAFKRRNS